MGVEKLSPCQQRPGRRRLWAWREGSRVLLTAVSFILDNPGRSCENKGVGEGKIYPDLVVLIRIE
jgi:hypothetical protein